MQGFSWLSPVLSGSWARAVAVRMRAVRMIRINEMVFKAAPPRVWLGRL